MRLLYALLLFLTRSHATTTAATRENPCLSLDVAEDAGVAEGVEGGGVVELWSGCVAVGDVGVVELSSTPAKSPY